MDIGRMQGRQVQSVRSWGKHFLLEFSDFSLRIHLMMFGSYRISKAKPMVPRLSLEFENGILNFYACSVKFVEGPLEENYDWTVDVMSSQWDPERACVKLCNADQMLICDGLLDQTIFSGVGNIIKNEVLFRVGVHPQSKTGAMPLQKIEAVVEQARQYSFEFLAWKRDYVFRKHWLVHRQSICQQCEGALTRAYLGKNSRVSYFCTRCQTYYRRR
jgi:endonuclease-8